ncbi:MAG: hypothetical protein KTR33_10040 [Gammaproteobacteria bacterium]|nr:hypothetical protein [Gammaproteobacteria bacterium]
MTSTSNTRWIGLFPAAGFGTRLNASGSKEIMPVTDTESATGESVAVGDLLLRQMHRAAVDDILLIRRAEKSDLADHYIHSGKFNGLNIIDQVIDATPSTTHTLDAVFEHWKDKPVALGFPDIILHPINVLQRLREKLEHTDAAICLALFPVDEPSRYDMVTLHDDRVSRIEIKPAATDSTLSWAAAVWRPHFSDYLHEQVRQHQSNRELYPGEVFNRAIRDQFPVLGVTFASGTALDVGTPAALAQARIKRTS